MHAVLYERWLVLISVTCLLIPDRISGHRFCSLALSFRAHGPCFPFPFFSARPSPPGLSTKHCPISDAPRSPQPAPHLFLAFVRSAHVKLSPSLVSIPNKNELSSGTEEGGATCTKPSCWRDPAAPLQSELIGLLAPPSPSPPTPAAGVYQGHTQLREEQRITKPRAGSMPLNSCIVQAKNPPLSTRRPSRSQPGQNWKPQDPISYSTGP